MSNFILIFISLFAGLIFQKNKSFPENTAQTINSFIIYISLPALTLFYIPKLDISWQMSLPLLMPFWILLVVWMILYLLNFHFRWDKKTLGILILLGGMGNLSFVGYPVVEAFYGEKGLEIALFVGQGGFLMVSILGVLIAVLYSGNKISIKYIIEKILLFPPFIAFILGVILNVFKVDFGLEIDNVLEILATTLTPLAMFSIGFQIDFNLKDIERKNVFLGLFLKLIFAPLFIYFLYSFILQAQGLILKVSVLEATMPAMVTASIIAKQYNLNSDLGNILISLGLFLAFPLFYFFYWFLG